MDPKAFPHQGYTDHQGEEHGYSEGMSLRDYFAAHAPAVPTDFPRLKERKIVDRAGGRKEEGYFDEDGQKQQARWAYQYADAMMKAREA